MTKTRSQAKTQGKKFIAKARELGCNENVRIFENKLKQIASAKTTPISKRPSAR